MTGLDIILILIGLVFALFIPGYFVTKLIFDRLSWVETLAFSVAFSIAINIVLGLFLGANKTMADLTGGISSINIWFYLLGIVFILIFILLVKIEYRRLK